MIRAIAAAVAVLAAPAFAAQDALTRSNAEARMVLAEGASAISFRHDPVGESSSWDAVMMRYDVAWPKVQIHNTFFAVASLCRKGELLQPVAGPAGRQCVSYSHQNDSVCEREIPVNLQRPIEYVHTFCEVWDRARESCVRTGSIPARIPLSYLVSVRVSQGGDREPREVFKKRFDIPACR